MAVYTDVAFDEAAALMQASGPATAARPAQQGSAPPSDAAALKSM